MNLSLPLSLEEKRVALSHYSEEDQKYFADISKGPINPTGIRLRSYQPASEQLILSYLEKYGVTAANIKKLYNLQSMKTLFGLIFETLTVQQAIPEVELQQLIKDECTYTFSDFLIIQKAIYTLYPQNTKPWPYPSDNLFHNKLRTFLSKPQADINLAKEFLVYDFNNHGCSLKKLTELYSLDDNELFTSALQTLAKMSLLNNEMICDVLKLALLKYDLKTLEQLQQIIVQNPSLYDIPIHLLKK
ncbi:MAG: hypothetical protein Q8R83_00610 [Legionellaceae bacterium]|nr:hypothetical protein [Legionellaceae bacterium]